MAKIKKTKKTADQAAATPAETAPTTTPPTTTEPTKKKKLKGKKRKADEDAPATTPAAAPVAETPEDSPPAKKAKKGGKKKKGAAAEPTAPMEEDKPAQETPQAPQTTPAVDPRAESTEEATELFWGKLPDGVSEEEAREAIGEGFVSFTQAPNKPFGFLSVTSSCSANLLQNPPMIRDAQTRIEERTNSKRTEDRAGRTLFVGSVPQNATEDNLRDHFSPLEPAQVRFSFKPDREYGVAFVEFNTPDEAQQAVNKGDLTIGDTTVRIKLDRDQGGGGGRGRGRDGGRDGGRGRGRGRSERTNDPSHELFLSNAPSDINDDIVQAHFSPIVPARIQWKFSPDRPTGFAFVTFNSVDEATQALNKGEISCGGQTCGLRFAQPKPEGGGGRGGGGDRGRGRGFGGDRGDRGRGFGDRGRGRGRGRGRDAGSQMKQGATGGGVAATGTKTTFDDDD